MLKVEEGEQPSLEVCLLANGATVARSKNAAIWLSTMAAITGETVTNSPSTEAAEQPVTRGSRRAVSSPLQAFAGDIGLDAAVLEAAADPTTGAPFIHLDHKYWEALRDKPGFGRTAPIVLASTLLLLWGRHTEIGNVTTEMCSKVLSPIGLTSKNGARSIRNCDWLQLRSSVIKLNPSAISKAEELVKAYCLARN